MSFSMFCSIPNPFWRVWDESVRSLMIAVFPFVGTVIGAIWALVWFVLNKINCPVIFTAAILSITPYILTGGIHLDGFMDCCDAIFSRRPLKKRREILKDSHVGSFAVIHLAMLFLIGFAAFASADGNENLWMLILICTISRASSAIGVSILRPMGHSEYAGKFQQDVKKINIISLIFILIASIAISFFVDGFVGLGSAVATSLGYAAFSAYAFKNLDGFSGDVTGFGHTLGELCGTIVLMLF